MLLIAQITILKIQLMVNVYCKMDARQIIMQIIHQAFVFYTAINRYIYIRMRIQ